MSIYFGDLHNHCDISYGYGALDNALNEAKQHLDFCSVTGHAMWPDMPVNEERLKFVVKYHNDGFEKLRKNWDKTRETINNANTEQFVTFHSYEIHSCEFGDYHIVSPYKNLELKYCRTPFDLFEIIRETADVIIIPHHTAYVKGFRGINWDEYDEQKSPVIEVFSKHGCAISDTSYYPYYHVMGPRVNEGTICNGLSMGKKFSFVASTDHHAGYPGSYGDGRVAVHAADKTRESIWKALKNGNTYAVTGDKIECNFSVNGNIMGSTIYDTGIRDIILNVKACDFIDKITIFKNNKVWKIMCPDEFSNGSSGRYKIRIEFGWGDSSELKKWMVNFNLTSGNILSVEPCFRGASVLSPEMQMKDNADINKLGNKIVKKTDNDYELHCTTAKNISTLHPQTASVIIEVEGNDHTLLNLNVNGIQKTICLTRFN